MHAICEQAWKHLPEGNLPQMDIIPCDSAALQCLADPSDATVAYLKCLAIDSFK